MKTAKYIVIGALLGVMNHDEVVNAIQMKSTITEKQSIESAHKHKKAHKKHKKKHSKK